MESSQDKNLPATERKLQKTRKDGQAARSRDLSHLSVLGMGALVVLFGGPTMVRHMHEAMLRQFSFNASIVRAPQQMVERLVDMASLGLVAVLILATLISAVSIITAVMAGGWVWSFKPITPQFNRVNPLSGIKNLLSMQQLVTAAKNVLLTTVLAWVSWLYLRSGIPELAMLPLQPSSSALAKVGDWIAGGVTLMLLVVFLVVLVDIPLQKFLFLRRLKMSHQEVKQEHKESEGSPEVKGKIRQKQREVAHRASVGRVPKADFVVTNPTHYAVALRYDETSMAAPQVVAMGADLVALKIREVAKAHEIPVLESPMLARALYANAELDQAIPATLYTAVAQVLAYVYRLKAALHGDGPPPGELVQPHVPPELDPHNKPSPPSQSTMESPAA
ncbi:MAG: flagellar biosynthesis protein FlhB [Acidovorax sp.]|jgi:flagellar biosynthetic protein FlhB|nr:flagellar biosynthesis protein FlhB [Acidovorax sp.]